MRNKILGKGRKTAAALLACGMLFAGAGGAEAASGYTAKDGDTFWKLSKRFGVPLSTLMAANPNVSARNIYKGLKLYIPDAKPVAAKATAAKPAALKATTDAKPAALMAAKAAPRSALIAAAVPGEAGGAPAKYFKSFTAKATAYTAAHAENGWGPVDYFGNPLEVGTVAVDPKVIALGTKLYIEGYDYNGLPQGGMYAIATDTGSAIKGKRIDIFVDDSRAEAKTFGYQYVKVYML